MSGEEEEINRLVERIDELLVLLNKISDDLRTVSASVKSLAVSRSTQPTIQSPAIFSHEIHETKTAIEDVRLVFPKALQNLLTFEEKSGHIIIKPKQFLGSENFAKIASLVRGLDGEYISEGKNSHFRLPKKQS